MKDVLENSLGELSTENRSIASRFSSGIWSDNLLFGWPPEVGGLDLEAMFHEIICIFKSYNHTQYGKMTTSWNPHENLDLVRKWQIQLFDHMLSPKHACI